MRKVLHVIVGTIIVMAVLRFTAAAQQTGQDKAADHSRAEKNPQPGRAYSGMYTFLKEGEFVQVSVEEDGRVTGFISRFEDEGSDQGAFVDQFFKTAKLDDNKLSFSSKVVHGVWFEFRGTVERGDGKNPGDEAYYVLKGTLIQNSTDADNKVNSRSREVEFKMFPHDVAPR
jgi:hypothetical protein